MRQLDRKLAKALARVSRGIAVDKGNRHMRKAGRTTWDVSDFDAATAELQRLTLAVAPKLLSHQERYWGPGGAYKDEMQ